MGRQASGRAATQKDNYRGAEAAASPNWRRTHLMKIACPRLGPAAPCACGRRVAAALGPRLGGRQQPTEVAARARGGRHSHGGGRRPPGGGRRLETHRPVLRLHEARCEPEPRGCALAPWWPRGHRRSSAGGRVPVQGVLASNAYAGANFFFSSAHSMVRIGGERYGIDVCSHRETDIAFRLLPGSWTNTENGAPAAASRRPELPAGPPSSLRRTR